MLLKSFPWDQGKSKSWCSLTLQVSDLLQEREQIENLEQTHEDLCTDEKRPEDQIENSRDEQELLW